MNLVVDNNRRKLIESMLFFTSAIKNCGKTRLFKLLWFFDEAYVKQTGSVATGSQWLAFPQGPVPGELIDEWGGFGSDINEAFEFRLTDVGKERLAECLVPQRPPDLSIFTRREIQILNDVLSKYRDISGEALSKITHDKDGSWYEVSETQGDIYGKISAEHILLKSPNRDQLLEEARYKASIIEYLNSIATDNR